MRRTFVSILVGMALVMPTEFLLAEPKSPKLAKCDGKKRRPANPYGSILPTVDPATGTSTPSNQQQGQGRERDGVDVFPEKAPTSTSPVKLEAKPTNQVPPISSASPPTPNQSC
nr:hypothetical protein [uncultured Sphingorhabdus sp.]